MTSFKSRLSEQQKTFTVKSIYKETQEARNILELQSKVSVVSHIKNNRSEEHNKSSVTFIR